MDTTESYWTFDNIMLSNPRQQREAVLELNDGEIRSTLHLPHAGNGPIDLVTIRLDQLLLFENQDKLDIWKIGDTMSIIHKYANAIQAIDLSHHGLDWLGGPRDALWKPTLDKLMFTICAEGGECLKSITIYTDILFMGALPGLLSSLHGTTSLPNLKHLSLLVTNDVRANNELRHYGPNNEFVGSLANALVQNTTLESVHFKMEFGLNTEIFLERLFKCLSEGLETDHSWTTLTIECHAGTPISFRHLAGLLAKRRLGQRLHHLIISNIYLCESETETFDNLELVMAGMPSRSLVDLKYLTIADDKVENVVDTFVRSRWLSEDNHSYLQFAVGCAQSSEGLEHPSARFACLERPENLNDSRRFLSWFFDIQDFISSMVQDAENWEYTYISDLFPHSHDNVQRMISLAANQFFPGPPPLPPKNDLDQNSSSDLPPSDANNQRGVKRTHSSLEDA